jgi:predicted nuclease of predicted toxin-antitoxin system
MTVDWLRTLDHDVLDIRGTNEQGMEDPGVWGAALAGNRILITTDRGFSQYRGPGHPGMLIVRLRQPNRLKIHKAIMLALSRFQPEDWPGMLVVVRDNTLSVSRRGGPVEQI